jgi:hypothetical protein
MCLCVCCFFIAVVVTVLKFWYGPLCLSTVSFWLPSGQVNSFGTHNIKFTGFLITIQSIKKLALFFHCTEVMWAGTVHSLLISKKSRYFLPRSSYFFIITKSGSCKIKFCLWVLYIVHTWLTNFLVCIFCIKLIFLNISLMLTKVCYIINEQIPLVEAYTCLN